MNTSFSQLPGAFAVGEARDRLVLAEDFIHEFYHNRLFCIEERGAFFEGQGDGAEPVDSYYSPWRYDPRPLQGLFHALYVFTGVCRYWLSVFGDPQLDGQDRVMQPERLHGKIDAVQIIERRHADRQQPFARHVVCSSGTRDMIVRRRRGRKVERA